MKTVNTVQVAVSVSLVLMACADMLPGSKPAQAQEPGRFKVAVEPSDNSLEGRPVMMSVIRAGKVVAQSEDRIRRSMASNWLGASENFSSDPGVYDVRIEGEGIITEVKRSVQLVRNLDTPVTFVARPGKGVHIVEYATGGVTREEIAARLEKLEAEVARLQKLEAAVSQLQKAGQSK
jgi:hypothetical protein